MHCLPASNALSFAVWAVSYRVADPLPRTMGACVGYVAVHTTMHANGYTAHVAGTLTMLSVSNHTGCMHVINALASSDMVLSGCSRPAF